MAKLMANQSEGLESEKRATRKNWALPLTNDARWSQKKRYLAVC